MEGIHGFSYGDFPCLALFPRRFVKPFGCVTPRVTPSRSSPASCGCRDERYASWFGCAKNRESKPSFLATTVADRTRLNSRRPGRFALTSCAVSIHAGVRDSFAFSCWTNSILKRCRVCEPYNAFCLRLRNAPPCAPVFRSGPLISAPRGRMHAGKWMPWISCGCRRGPW
jgi:hypothetical protein